MKTFLYVLIALVALDASILNTDFAQRAEDDEIEFVSDVTAILREVTAHLKIRPLTTSFYTRQSLCFFQRIDFYVGKNEPCLYYRTPADVAVNSDS